MGLFALLAIALVCQAALAGVIGPNTLLVTSSLDTGDDATAAGSLAADQSDGDGLGIREALHWALAGDTITFDLDSSTAGNQGGSITLNGSQLVVASSDLSIDGDLDGDGMPDVVISANDASRVMIINGSLTDIALSGLTLTEGNAVGGGGGLYVGVNSSVTVRDSIISNSVDMIGGGGGVFGSSVTLTMINTTVSGNTSTNFGGGIRVVGASAFNLVNSTVSGNSTTGTGAHGGGIQIASSSSPMNLVNVTISGNAALGAGAFGGGLRITSGTSFLYNTTIVGNASAGAGGGVHANALDTLVNTVVAGNTSGAGATPGAGGSPLATGGSADDVGGLIESADHSYFGSNAAIGSDNGSLNNQGTGSLLLGNLGLNSGGTVPTHVPQVGSALVDAGSNAARPSDTFDLDGDSDTAEALPVDANADSRVKNLVVDIGAVEGYAAPAVVSVGVPADGTYAAGQHLDLTVITDDNVIVDSTGGIPRIALTIGATTRYATYIGGGGSTALVFRYTVQAGDSDSDGIDVAASIEPNGGTLQDAIGTDLDTTLNAIGSTAGVLVDALAPVVVSVSVPANGTYTGGQNLDFVIHTSEAVIVDGSSGIPRIALTIGATTRYASYVSGSGSAALLFRYTVQPGDNDADGIAVDALEANGGTLRDAAGNDLNGSLTAVGDTSGVLVDALAPGGHSVSFDDAAINAADASSVGFTFANAELGAGYSFTITSSGGGTPVAGSGTIVAAGQQIAGIDVSGLVDGTLTLSVTLTDTAGNSAAAVGDTALLDTLAPSVSTLAVADTTLESGDTTTLSISFTEPVSGLTASDFSVPNASIDAPVSSDGGTTWSATLTPAGGTAATGNVVTLDLAGVADAAGNPGSGSAQSNAYDVDTALFTVGGTVSGLGGSGLVLQNNGGDDLAIAASGGFTFATALADGSAYNVTVAVQPGSPDQECVVSQGSGAIDAANVTDVTVACSDVQQVPGVPTGVTGVPGDGQISVSWAAPADDGGSPIIRYLVTATPATGDPGTCETDGTSTSCVIDGLVNGTAYTVSVVASNALGDGPPASAGATVTPMGGATGQPEPLMIPSSSPLALLLAALAMLLIGGIAHARGISRAAARKR